MSSTNTEQTAFRELSESILATLETYSNVHRGSGHYSLATTRIFEHAREIVLEYLGLNKKRYLVIFGTHYRAEILRKQIDPQCVRMITSKETGLSLGVCALVVKRGSIPKSIRFHTGGGTARLVSRNKVIWAKEPDRFEAGTPAIINIIAFGRALQLLKKYKISNFGSPEQGQDTSGIYENDVLQRFSGKLLLDEIRKTMIGNGLPVPSAEGPVPFINLDNSASTPSFLPVWDSARLAMRMTGQEGQDIVRETSAVCADFLNAP